MRWYVIDGSQKLGPFTASQIHARLRSGEVSLDTHLLREGSSVRRKLVDVVELFSGPSEASEPKREEVEATRFASSGEEVTEQTIEPPRGGTVVASPSLRAPEPRFSSSEEETQSNASAPMPPPAPSELDLHLDNLNPEALFESISMPAKRENLSQMSSPFALNSWNLLGARASAAQKRRTVEGEHLASPDLVVREKSSPEKPGLQIELAPKAPVVSPELPQAKPEEPEERLPPQPRRKPAPAARPRAPVARPPVRSAGIDLTVVALGTACAALIILVFVLFSLKKPAREKVVDSSVLTQALPPTLPKPPPENPAAAGEPLEEIFPGWEESRKPAKRKPAAVPKPSSEGKEKAPKKAKPTPRPQEKVQVRDKPRTARLAARSGVVPEGWPPAMGSHRELVQTQARLVSVTGVHVEQIPSQCSPCRIRGRLDDGGQLVLVSPNLQLWRAAGMRAGGRVAVKGLIIRKSPGEVWLVLQGVSSRD